MDLEFEWDEEKAELNIFKHDVSFEEAITVFGDMQALTRFDDRHSLFEDRYITIGFSNLLRILVVVYTERNSNTRIISARKATPREQKQYERQNT